MNFNRLKDCVVTNKNVILRVDINVPMKNGNIEDDTRIKAVIPTIKYLVKNQAKVILISHFGRPKGKKVPEMSLKQPALPRTGDGNTQTRFLQITEQPITINRECHTTPLAHPGRLSQIPAEILAFQVAVQPAKSK